MNDKAWEITCSIIGYECGGVAGRGSVLPEKMSGIRGSSTSWVVLSSCAAEFPSLTNHHVPLSGPEARGGISIAKLTLANGRRSIFIEPQTVCYDDCFGMRAQIVVTHAVANLFRIIWTQTGRGYLSFGTQTG